MKAKLLLSLLLISLIWTGTPPFLLAQEPDYVIMEVSDGWGEPGSTGNSVYISADNSTYNETPISGVEVRLQYDSSIGIHCQDVLTTSRSEGYQVAYFVDESTPQESEVHILLYALHLSPIPPGTGPILELLFDVEETAQRGDSSPLLFTEVILVDEEGNPIPIDYSDTGIFTIPLLTCQLTMSVYPPGAGTVSPSEGIHTYEFGTVVPIDANPNPGWSFDHWEGEVDGSPAQKSNQVTMDADKIITAVFVEVEPVVFSLSDGFSLPGGSGTVLIGVDNQTFNPAPIKAIEIWLRYDSTQGIHFHINSDYPRGVGRGENFLIGASVDESDPQNSIAHIVMSGLSDCIEPGTGPILELLFDVEEEASPGKIIPLSFLQVEVLDPQDQPLPVDYSDTGTFTVGLVLVELDPQDTQLQHGDTLWHTLTLTNLTDSRQTFYFVEAITKTPYGPGLHLIGRVRRISLSPHHSISRDLPLYIYPFFPLGEYTYSAFVFRSIYEVWDKDSFSFTVNP